MSKSDELLDKDFLRCLVSKCGLLLHYPLCLVACVTFDAADSFSLDGVFDSFSQAAEDKAGHLALDDGFFF